MNLESRILNLEYFAIRNSRFAIARTIIALAASMLLCLSVPRAAQAEEAGLQLEQANQMYRSGKYQDAAKSYEQIVKNGYESPELYFNLGNAYFKTNAIPSAIIAYERAKRLAPHDEDIAYNLRLANLRIVDKIEPLPGLFIFDWWHGFVNLFAADRWATLTIIFFWGMAACGAIFVTTRSFIARRIAGILAGIFVIFGALSFVCEVQRDRVEHNSSAAIIVTQSVPVKSAPDAGSTDLFVVHEGLKVEVLDAVGEWKKVRLADGKIGWVGEKSVVGI